MYICGGKPLTQHLLFMLEIIGIIFLIIIGIILLRLALLALAMALGCSLMVGFFCGIFWLLGWMEGETVKDCMYWGFIVGIPIGIVYTLLHPGEAFEDEGSSSSSSGSGSSYPKHVTFHQHANGEYYYYGDDGRTHFVTKTGECWSDSEGNYFDDNGYNHR